MLVPLFSAKFAIHCKCLMHMVALAIAGACAPLRMVGPVFCGCMLMAHGNTQGKLAKHVKNMVGHDNFLEIVVEGSITGRETKFLDRLLDLLHWDEALVDGALTRSEKAKKELNDAIAELNRLQAKPPRKGDERERLVSLNSSPEMET